jgi:hypothetical protein
MSKSRLIFVASLFILTLVPASFAADHLVAPDAVSQRLAAHSAQRQADLADVQRVLATPQAAEAMKTLGADPGDVRAGVATLSTSELADLATRARTLKVDPAGGLDSDVNTLLVVFLIVAIVILVITAVD